jgi:phosphohistidine phosphatase
MRSLTLLRHAKTERESLTGRDLDRSLDDRGQADAKRMGEEIRHLGLSFDLVLASPARRVVETVESVGGLQPEWDEQIYNATIGELLAIAQAVSNAERLMLVGHNPGFEELASMLIGVPIAMPTGALVEIELPIERWRDVGSERGRLVRFVKPKELV